MSLYDESIIQDYDKVTTGHLLEALRRLHNVRNVNDGQMLSFFDIFIDILSQVRNLLIPEIRSKAVGIGVACHRSPFGKFENSTPILGGFYPRQVDETLLTRFFLMR